ncbi:MAG: ligand-binding sensor domain-containing protein [Planctomycetota bacterium]|jgi:hypothetical protein
MNTNVIYPKAFKYFLCACVIACLSISDNLRGEVRKQWTVIPIQVEGEKETYLTDFAIDKEGLPWVALSKPNNTICYWQGGKWQRLEDKFTTGTYLARLYASPNGKVYLSQPDRGPFFKPASRSKAHFGGLYLLEKGKATYVTDYYYEVAHYKPNLYFDRKGRIWNWGARFIAKYEDEQWERVEASIGSCRIVEDTKGNVYFISNKTISYYKDGIFKTDIKLPDIAYQMRDASFKCCLWGDDKAMLIRYGKTGAWVLDLKKLEVQKSNFLKTPLSESSLYDLFRDAQGNVWVLAHNGKKAKNYFYIKVSVKDGKVEEHLSTAEIKWDNHRSFQYPESVLSTSNGAIYFGPPRDGIYIFRDGKVHHFGWQKGISLNSTDWVSQGKEGTIWFASRKTGIIIYDPIGIQTEEPDSYFLRTWKEFQLTKRLLISDFDRNIWCCLKDKPNAISMWNGKSWEYFEFGADVTKINGFFVDDINRLHITMYDYPSGVYRLRSGNIEHFKDTREMLKYSVQSGSRQFRGLNPGRILTPLVTKNKEIWYALNNYGRFNHYDGIKWHEFDTKGTGRIQNIFKLDEDSIIIHSGKKFLTLDKGQVVELENQNTQNKRHLVGECGVIPFNKEIYQANRDKLYPAYKAYEGMYLFDNDDTAFLNFKENNVPRTAIKISKYLERIWLVDGGFWAHEDNLALLKRYYKGFMLNVDLTTTPIGRLLWAHQCSVAEDRAGNLWIRNRDKAFMIKQEALDTIITTPKKIMYEARKIRIGFEGLADNKKSDKLKYTWRLDDGKWSQPSRNNFVELSFNKSGFHNFEVISVGQMGNIDTTAATLKLNIVIPTPQVRIVSLPDHELEVPIVVEYEVVKRQQDSRLTFQWRIDGGQWNNTSDTKVTLWSLEDGKHVFEVRAVEDDKYVQLKPAKVEFVLKTDYKRIILREIKRLKSDSYLEREKAAAALISIGEKCLPYLEKELEKATRDTEWWIKNVIWKIEH